MHQAKPVSQSPETQKHCGLLRLLLVITYDIVIVVGLLLIATALASPFDNDNQHAMRDIGFTLYLALFWFFYLAICWRHGGMTLGMRAWHVKMDSDHGRPSWGQCVLRFLVSILSAGVIGLGFAWILWERKNRSWHDLASNTSLQRWS